MRKLILIALLFLSGGGVGYYLFLELLPVYSTDRILLAVTGGSKNLNRWYYIPAVSGKQRTVRMASPDFYYAYCLFDLSASKLKIAIAPWAGFQSLSVYDLNDRHVTSFSLETGKTFSTILSQLPMSKGFLLLRRVRTGPLRKDLGDQCEAIPLT